MSEMIERVTRAVEKIIDQVPMVDASPSRIREIRAGWIARAAIEAMQFTPAELRAAAIARALREDAALKE